ncbi:MAG: hypothetical protein M3Z03_10435 [Actinomycetota bacterium]|nr:hypothetical protein [Actinomycetota bacterium]
MRIVRRFIPQLGFLTVAGFVWNHRGTVRRAVDLAVDVPQILRDDGLDGVVQQGKVLFELDRTRPTDMKARLPEPGAQVAAQPA